MKTDERDELLIELRTAVLGVKGSDEKGIVGDVKAIKKHQEEQNDHILNALIASGKNTVWRKVIVGIGGLYITTTIALLVTKIQGLW